VLYAVDLADSRSDEKSQVGDVFAEVARSFDLPEGAREYAEELVEGVAAKRDALDEHIARCARNWRLERMAAVDRNVLRLATYELGRGDMPASVIIDQAIELARRFGADASPGFVNGVLDAVAREMGCVESSKEVR
jgi:N utilization substance protein B